MLPHGQHQKICAITGKKIYVKIPIILQPLVKNSDKPVCLSMAYSYSLTHGRTVQNFNLKNPLLFSNY